MPERCWQGKSYKRSWINTTPSLRLTRKICYNVCNCSTQLWCFLSTHWSQYITDGSFCKQPDTSSTFCLRNSIVAKATGCGGPVWNCAPCHHRTPPVKISCVVNVGFRRDAASHARHRGWVGVVPADCKCLRVVHPRSHCLYSSGVGVASQVRIDHTYQ